jgi:hypothetical protein
MEDDFSDCLQSAIQDRRSENSKRNIVRPITDLDKQIAETRRLVQLCLLFRLFVYNSHFMKHAVQVELSDTRGGAGGNVLGKYAQHE